MQAAASVPVHARVRRTAHATWLLLLVLVLPMTVQAEAPNPAATTIEVFAEDGTITRVPAPMTPQHPAEARLVAQTNVATIQTTGPVTNRIAIVMLGDGYTEAQLGTYATHTNHVWQYVTQVEPFKTYQSYFTVYRVDVVSPDAGVDNDPTRGITRQTALDMYFWCSNLQRLLCVNRTKALHYAAQAPHADQIIAIANTTMYGGAGGTDIATVAGGNSAAPEILVHELGHSLGQLHDEYVLTPGVYEGPESPAANTSIFPTTTMGHAQVKWYRWLGAASPDGSIIGTYPGASHGTTGIYRPSENSGMRSLRQPFNSPSREALVMALYRRVRPIDRSTPITATLTPNDTITVMPLQPSGHQLTVTWRVNGSIIAAAQNQHQLRLADHGLHHQAIVTVEVTDPTPFVRDEAFRAAFMRETRQWTVTGPDPTVWRIALPMTLHGGVQTSSTAPHETFAAHVVSANARISLTAKMKWVLAGF